MPQRITDLTVGKEVTHYKGHGKSGNRRNVTELMQFCLSIISCVRLSPLPPSSPNAGACDARHSSGMSHSLNRNS